MIEKSTLQKAVVQSLTTEHQLYLDNIAGLYTKARPATVPTINASTSPYAPVEEAIQDELDALLDQYDMSLMFVASNDPVQTKS